MSLALKAPAGKPMAFWNPPWCTSTTMASTPRLRSSRDQRVHGVRLVAELEAGDAGGRDDGRRALERHADERDLRRGLRRRRNVLMPYGGSSVWPVDVADDVGRQPLELRAFERHRRARPRRRGSCSGRRAPFVILQPPFCRRSSSAKPLSNSWLPTALNSRPMRFSVSTDGSSKNSAEISGDAPMKSPAPTTTLFGFSALASRRARPRTRRRRPAGR